MKLTHSEIFRIQQINDNLQTIIKIAEEGRRRELERFEVEKCMTIIENCGAEFYMIIQDMKDRRLSQEYEKC